MICGRNNDSEFYSYSESNCGALDPNCTQLRRDESRLKNCAKDLSALLL